MTCYTCKHDGKCGISGNPDRCPYYQKQATALQEEK